jgi:hypothetical protein
MTRVMVGKISEYLQWLVMLESYHCHQSWVRSIIPLWKACSSGLDRMKGERWLRNCKGPRGGLKCSGASKQSAGQAAILKGEETYNLWGERAKTRGSMKSKGRVSSCIWSPI